MTDQNFLPDFLERLKAVKGKRARTVVEHILKHGFITTEELATQYGYNHAPRAVRDVREQGIALETFSVKNAEGRSIAAYRFADPSQVHYDKVGGRKVFPKAFKRQLLEIYNSRCAICLEEYEERYLQIDHRVPYEIAGESPDTERNPDDYMLVCGSCNRAKSWSCEHCLNWQEQKAPAICQSCYWAYPNNYKHIALRAIRRLDITWTESEVEMYESLKQAAEQTNTLLPDYVKSIFERYLKDNQ